MIKKRSLWIIILFLVTGVFNIRSFAQTKLEKNKGLYFTSLPDRWDEAIPLGNGMLGALIYKKDGMLRIALDRSDLWDLKPIKAFESPQFTYQWMVQQVLSKNDTPIKRMMDHPYDKSAGPTKIPAAALEFPINDLGKIRSVSLNIVTATCHIYWINGATATFFISAKDHAGHFRFKKLPEKISSIFPQLIPPEYQTTKYNAHGDAVVGGQDLARLGYPKGKVQRTENAINYHQQGWKDFSYDVAVKWKQFDQNVIVGTWSIASQGSPYSKTETAKEIVLKSLNSSFVNTWNQHKKWWNHYWQQSSVHLPDSVLQHQYNMDIYLFGAASRKGNPPISLQAVWTADDGKLPPWHGDYHNDLNTQLSYWPGYAANHLQESAAFTDWLWKMKPVTKAFTKKFFEDDGLNMPGVCTLTGHPMGGWAQYSFSATVSAWVAQNFYWQWVYSGDKQFLEQRAYPWVKEVAKHIESIAIKDKTNHWKLPISSSPEFFDNTLKAWFLQTSNFDLSLIRWQLQTAIQMADTLGLKKDAAHWKQFLSGWPQLALNPPDSALVVAPSIPYSFSHRHFSHLMSIYPLQLIDWYQGEKARKIINASLNELKKYGPSAWCGYSYAWLACLKAMAQDGTGAAKALKIFATAFCSTNGFHLNGDQSGKGYSGFTYRPFTLEGNFAFAQGVQLMLLQQHDRVNYIFPAIPANWKNVSFQNLRAPGAFLISAKKENGKVTELQIKSLKEGTIKIKNPFLHQKVQVEGIQMPVDAFDQEVLVMSLSKGQIVEVKY